MAGTGGGLYQYHTRILQFAQKTTDVGIAYTSRDNTDCNDVNSRFKIPLVLF